MNLQLWFVFFSLLNLVRAAFECPTDIGCGDCRKNLEQVYEINCATTSNGVIQVQIKPDDYVRLICRNYVNWTNFHLGHSRSMKNIKLLSFDECNLPKSNQLKFVIKQLLNEKIETLHFRSNVQVRTIIDRETFQGLGSLKKLTLTAIDLSDVAADIFQELPNLKMLNLQNTNLQNLPNNLFRSENLEAIELSTNQLVTLNYSSFVKLKNLRLLNVWNNKIVKIHENAFDDLVSLETLNLRRNKLENLPNNVFHRLANLKILRLSENNFKLNSLSSDLLRECKNLENFELMQNRRNMTTLPESFFANLTKLSFIKLRKIGLLSLHENLFWGAVNLKNISLERNYLTTLPRQIFKDNYELLTLDLNFNDLTFLPDDVFVNLKKLVKLDLSRNHLAVINEKIFSGLTSLRELNVERNNIISIHHEAFGSLLMLRVARFSYNVFTLESSEMILESPFHYSQLLEELYLDHNNISSIPADWIYSMNSIRVLNLSYNKLQFLTHEDLQFLSEDLYVDLTHNNISHIFMDRVESWAVERTYSRNVIISVENNPIECDCDLYDLLRYFENRLHPNVKNAFRLEIGQTRCETPKELRNVPVVDLKSKILKCDADTAIFKGNCPESCKCYIRPENKACLIDCANQGLVEAPRKIECPQNRTIELNLSGNSLTSVPNLNQPGYDRVTVLSLEHNSISKISIDILSSTLKILRLNNNDLSKLDRAVVDFFNNSKQLKELTLEMNPWSCDCETRDFLTFVQDKSAMMPDLQKITCADQEISMFQMTSEELCSSNIDWIMGGCLVAFFGIIIGALSAVYYRYQREVKVWLYAKNFCLWFVTENELDKDKLYDAFISYSHKDEDFVVNDLMPNLEKDPRPFKLCVHFRDWLAGEFIPKQIARSVDESRRTIVVLSPNFLESVWGRMEFRAAHSQALSEGRARVIVVLYGDIGPTNDLDPELKAYLSMNTYVKWGDPWFWQKLNYAMPHPREFRDKKCRKNVFETTQPHIGMINDKIELINPPGTPSTPPIASTPPADSLKIFIVDGISSEEKDIKRNDSSNIVTNSNNKMSNGLVKNIQHTTV